MAIMVDSNILLRFVDKAHKQHLIAAQVVRTLRQRKEQLVMVPQNVYEFWSVATRPLANNGLGITPIQAETELVGLGGFFDLLPDEPTLYTEWRRLVTTYSVSGKPTHDARLVAAMVTHGITALLTFNFADFARYLPESVTALDPATV